LLGCSQRKRLDEGLLPAIDRYDGPTFRLLRRYLKQDLTLSVDAKILSAEYGIISTAHSLPYYDRRITKEQSQKLNHQAVEELGAILCAKPYTNLLICLGKDYFETIYGYETILPKGLEIQIAIGGIGRKLSILHDWLYGDLSNLHSIQGLTSTKSKVCIRGVEVNLTSEQILDVARQAIATKDRRATHYQSWYVQVGDQRVSPKWLVSQITGLQVSNFVTDDARRVLTRLGVEVKRV
jgi:hypothetical protein